MGEMGALDGDTALGVSEEVRDPANSKALRKKEEDVDEGKAWEAPSSAPCWDWPHLGGLAAVTCLPGLGCLIPNWGGMQSHACLLACAPAAPAWGLGEICLHPLPPHPGSSLRAMECELCVLGSLARAELP